MSETPYTNFFKVAYSVGIVVWIGFSFPFGVIAQAEYAYKRSSLHLVLVDQAPYNSSRILKPAFFDSAFPDKYDPLPIQDTVLRLIDENSWRSRGAPPYTDHDRIVTCFVKNFGVIDKWLADVMQPEEELVEGFIQKYIEEKDLARKLVAKWFQRDKDGSFSIQMVQDRGAYSASMLDASISQNSALGTNQLRDAGTELIGQTFVLFTNLTLIDNYLFVRAIEEKVKRVMRPESNLGQIAALKRKLSHKIVRNLEDGFMVWTTGYLFQLKWNEEIENRFFSEMWIPRGQKNPERKALFESTNLFELEYVGNSYAQSLVTKKLIGDDTNQDIVRRVTLRNVESCYAKLQKTYDVFKTKTPLLSVNPASAQIGMKEGLEGGERFEVLEVLEDSETGMQSLRRVGVIKVDKNKIWDNRFGADELLDSEANLGRTYFHGSGDFLPGMLIRLIK